MTDIRCLVLDVDGVLTDGRLYYGLDAQPVRAFYIHDGLAIEWFQRLCGPVVILTAKQSTATETRAAELGIKHLLQGSRDKLADLLELLASLDIPIEQTAMVGDDLPDLAVLSACGYPIAPANAVAEVRVVARHVTDKPGGKGAVREAIEHLLGRQGRWREVVTHYETSKTPAANV